jgi:hypothetical protein
MVLTPSIVAALEPDRGCNNCREKRVNETCEPGYPCWHYEHDFGPLPGCWEGQDCRECVPTEHYGCHGWDETGECSPHRFCPATFAALSDDLKAATTIPPGDVLDHLTNLVRPGSVLMPLVDTFMVSPIWERF